MPQLTFIGRFPLSETLFNLNNLGAMIRFKAKYPFEIVTDKYVIKTAENFKELYAAMRLRFFSFSPWANKNLLPFRIDIDEYDYLCDHIVIYDRKKEHLCGTYRVRTSLFAEQFYSQQEFNMDQFLNAPGVKMELGRACISPEYRNGSVIDLLWRGIAKYIQMTNSRYLFGCSSIKTVEDTLAQRLYDMLACDGKVSNQYNIAPTDDFQMNIDTEAWKSEQKAFNREDKRMLPPLLRTYLNGGALIHGTPALDRNFLCVDFLTILDVEKLNPVFKKRYFS